MIKKIFNIQYSIFNINPQGGFTVLEAIVAILAVTLAITAVFGAVRQSLSQNIIAKDEITAFYLAQEGMEIVRNIRDSNQLKIINGGGGNWLDGITGAADCSTGQFCRANVNSNGTLDLVLCPAGNCPNLQQNAQFIYSQSLGGNSTTFNRKIQIEELPNGREIEVTVWVYYTKGSETRNVMLKTYLINWVG
ncbi:MAG: hypothetical protein JW740_00220 [Candidatus Zambryskibacteria bacterium]|nr:hypothetical protein [Candidatus Zambryskibacteria bacterium]